ncbi:MAG: hypothetical protein IT371_27240 [Deltaproteobacteria bacterium]|nr:hypothetical protein [Deltaproteobacteria bacterium]
MTPPSRRGRALLVGAVLLLGLAPFLPAVGGEFLNWDDDRFVVENPLVRGASLAHLKAIFGAPHFEAYHPLHLASYLVDHRLFGDWAPGYRLHNLLLYLVCLELLRRLLLRLGVPFAAALFGTALFALHPLHVEAVVWVSARKETLSLAFFLGSALCYLGAASWRERRMWVAALLFGAALLSKTSTVVLPLVLVAAESALGRRTLRQSLVRALPLVGLAAAVGLYVVGLWQANEMVRPLPEGGLFGRAALVCKTYGHHLLKLVAPLDLGPVYPTSGLGRFDRLAALGAVGLVALGLGSWRARSPFVRLGALWLLVALLPVANLVPVYFVVQDRYAFIPSVAVALVGSALALRLAEATPSVRRVGVAAGAALCLAFAALSARQAHAWRSNESLWRLAVLSQPEAYFAHLGLGHTLRKTRRFEEAVTVYARAVSLEPRWPWARVALCLADVDRRDLGRTDGSRAARVERELARAWGRAEASIERSVALLGEGLLRCAQVAEGRAFELLPPRPADLLAAASRWTAAGQGQVALRHLAQVGEPARSGAAWHELDAQALALLGRHDVARAALRRSLALEPRPAAALLRSARALLALGRPELARLYLEAVPRGAAEGPSEAPPATLPAPRGP